MPDSMATLASVVPGQAASARLLWAPHAWVGGRWRNAVLLCIDASGHWCEISPDSACPPAAALLPAPVLPGLINAHSHAFQRAFVGLAERCATDRDDFWSWRDGMYRVALRIDVAQLRVLATQLYRELLAGGYTQVCEFHYLHHRSDGSRHTALAEMSLALADAAAATGIGLTLLPVLYERAGFTQPALRADQRRFATSVEEVLALRREIDAAQRPLVNSGVAVHSLRAARAESVLALAERSGSGPIHIHVAEQTQEVQDCLAATGQRPVAWLAAHAPLDARWQLVHATHSEPAEIGAVARSGAGIVITPGTEANLGDGLTDLPGWLRAGVPLAIGSDSQVTRAWPEELRWLEYGQRLLHRRRNIAADAAGGETATASRLFNCVQRGGAAAAGFAHWGLEVGARADLLVLNTADSALAGLDHQHLLDATIFAAPAAPFAAVMVAGRWIETGADLGAFRQVMAQLR